MTLHENGEIVAKQPLIIGGIACELETVGRDQLPLIGLEEHRSLWDKSIKDLQGLPVVEIQYEGPLEKNRWQGVVERPDGCHTLGVHQPLCGRNILSFNPLERQVALGDSLRSMNMANAIGADYFVTHLDFVDVWSEDRSVVLERALSTFSKLAVWHRKNAHTYDLCVEFPLEFPKHPSTLEDFTTIVELMLQIYPNTKIIFDVAHHWHNTTHLAPDTWEGDWGHALTQALNLIEGFKPGLIQGFHFGGSYVDTEADTHVTHGIPGTHGEYDRKNLFLGEAPDSFNGSWMAVLSTLQVLSEFAKTNYPEGLPVVLEVQGLKDKIEYTKLLTEAFYS
jgi:sugar phosphate isomerase/epimerase